MLWRSLRSLSEKSRQSEHTLKLVTAIFLSTRKGKTWYLLAAIHGGNRNLSLFVCFFVCLLRYEKQLEQEEQAYQQQRRRLYAEVQEEKERVALQAQKQRQELDEARGALEVSLGVLWFGAVSSYSTIDGRE